MAEKLKLTIVTPDREFYKDDVDMVEFNTTAVSYTHLRAHETSV